MQRPLGLQQIIIQHVVIIGGFDCGAALHADAVTIGLGWGNFKADYGGEWATVQRLLVSLLKLIAAAVLA